MAEEFVLRQVASEVQRAIDNALNPDTTLTEKGKPADAKAVGDALATIGTVENVSIFAGKTASFYGDSITKVINNHYTKGYHSWVKDILGLASYKNYGEGGYKVSDVYNRVNSVTDTADIIFVMCGVNDQNFSVPLGTFGDNTVNTTYGSLELLCGLLKSKYPTKVIVFITPHYQTMYPHKNGITSYEVSKAIREVCEKHSIVVYDNFVKSGICDTNLSYWTVDNCHWNDYAHEMVGKNLARFVSDTFCYMYGIDVTKTLTSITATFNCGNNVIYETDSLDTLKQHLIVTANYSDGSIETITSYTMNGMLETGTSIITVVYGGKTATFIVTVSASEKPTYTITNNLNNVTSSNTVTKANEGAYYVAILTANSGHKIDAVTVTMGGNDITATAYSSGTVSIPSVIGDVVITAVASINPDANTFTILTGENGKNQFHLVALGVKPDNLAGNEVVVTLEGSNAVNLTNQSGGPPTVVYGDVSGDVSNDEYSGQCTDVVPTCETVVTDGRITATAKCVGTNLDSPYVKYVLRLYPRAFPASFTLDTFKVTVGGVEQEILKIGSFFSSETFTIT